MNIDEKRYKNNERCLNCKYYVCGGCSLLGDMISSQIDNCILEDSRVKQLKESSAEWFMFKNNPELFLTYLNYQRKEKLPEIGSKVVTLRNGFGGYAGVIRYIDSINEKFIVLTNKNGGKYSSKIETWYNDFFEI